MRYDPEIPASGPPPLSLLPDTVRVIILTAGPGFRSSDQPLPSESDSFKTAGK